MRIAFCGTHRTGKSTLLEAVAEHLPDHATVDEPYHLLEEEGYEAADPPTLEDFVAQLERSLESLDGGATNVLFDRAPADILAYLTTHEDADAFEPQAWMERVTTAMGTLDLVVFVPVEEPDRVALPRHEDRAQRLAVHDALEALLVDGGLGCEVEVLRVEGNARSRVEQVMARVGAATAPPGRRGAARPGAPTRSRRRR